MAKEKPKPRPARSGTQLSTYVDDDISAAMKAFIDAHNATDEHPASIRSTVEAALKLYLKDKGFWPPKSDAK